MCYRRGGPRYRVLHKHNSKLCLSMNLEQKRSNITDQALENHLTHAALDVTPPHGCVVLRPRRSPRAFMYPPAVSALTRSLSSIPAPTTPAPTLPPPPVSIRRRSHGESSPGLPRLACCHIVGYQDVANHPTLAHLCKAWKQFNHSHAPTHARTHALVMMYANMNVCMCACVRARMCVNACINACVCACMRYLCNVLEHVTCGKLKNRTSPLPATSRAPVAPPRHSA